MKTICFYNTTPFWGGGEKFYFEYALGLKNKGYTIFIACSENSPLHTKAAENNINRFIINTSNLSFLNPFKISTVVSFFKKNNIDTVIFSTSPDLKLGGIAAKLAHVTNRVYRRGLAVPIKNSFLNRYLFGKVITKIFANSEETKQTILQHLHATIRPEKIKVIYNGIDVSKINTETTLPLEFINHHKKGVVLGNIGRLTSQKCQNQLIEVAKKLKEKNIVFSLFIGGSGELQEPLRQQIQKYGLVNDVYLTGFVNDVYSFMKSIDIFLLSSQWEGFGYVLVEAMLFEKPIVAYQITSNPEIVKKDETGFLVDFGNTTDFSEKVELLINNTELRKTMGNAGKKRVQTHFDFQKKVEELILFLNRNKEL